MTGGSPLLATGSAGLPHRVSPTPSSDHSTQTVQLPRLTRRLKRPIRQQPQPLRRRLSRCNPRDIMSMCLHKGDRGVIIRGLEARHARNQLIMQSRHLQRLRRRHIAIEHIPQVLYSARDDAGAAGGADGEVEGAVGEVLDDCGGDAGEGAFAGDDVIRWAGRIAECIGHCTGRWC